ncbi:Meckel syndrome type 1 protein homolog isoform X2 [Homarus americanus]|uniref:Meckel syndrome type 1 protein homolog isoform X2 n=1 Tax=Homarus americanus TaxID=6706 RepID=UPI001C45947E|nr:Meckel syndrome type 1 protein homolog isoform X2 [Homarus americanus]
MEPMRDQCAYYYTKQQIDNLLVRVSLQQLTGTQLVDVSPRVVEDTSGVKKEELALASRSVLSVHSHDTSVSHTQQQVIKWQQKILSPCETVEYGRPIYANDQKYKTRHEQAIKLKKLKQWKRRIFTYIQQDNFHWQNQDAVTFSKRQETDGWLRQRKNTSSRRKSDKDNNSSISEGNKEVDKTTAKGTGVIQSLEQQYFYIMADLAPSECLGESKAHEVVLCKICYDLQGQLAVTPDFTMPTTKAYRLESFGSDNALYEYTIENTSLTRSAEEKHQDDQLVKQIVHQQLEEIQQIVGLDWDGQKRGEGELRLLVVGEITRALHFSEASSLYVHYVLHLPPGWRANPGTECEGFTPSCNVGYVDGTHTAHYSTPFSLDVTRSKSGGGWPLLLLAVFSVDWLGQDRDEGYAAFPLVSPENVTDDPRHCKDMGSNVHAVNTWRPAQLSPLSLMRRFFIGGCQLMVDSSYLAIGSNSKGRVSRLGFSTVSSGSLELRTNTLIQVESLETDLTVQMENSSSWQLSTLAVIDAFNKSRQKLRAAKQGLL